MSTRSGAHSFASSTPCSPVRASMTSYPANSQHVAYQLEVPLVVLDDEDPVIGHSVSDAGAACASVAMRTRSTRTAGSKSPFWAT